MASRHCCRHLSLSCSCCGATTLLILQTHSDSSWSCIHVGTLVSLAGLRHWATRLECESPRNRPVIKKHGCLCSNQHWVAMTCRTILQVAVLRAGIALNSPNESVREETSIGIHPSSHLICVDGRLQGNPQPRCAPYRSGINEVNAASYCVSILQQLDFLEYIVLSARGWSRCISISTTVCSK